MSIEMTGAEFNAKNELEQIAATFERFEVDGGWTDNGIQANLNSYHANKVGLLHLLRKHPNWNEQAKAVIVPFFEERKFNIESVAHEFNELREYIEFVVDNNELKQKGDINIMAYLRIIIMNRYLKEPIIDASVISEIKKYMRRGDEFISLLRIRAGQKWSKIIRKAIDSITIDDGRKLMEVLDDDDKHNIERRYARLADALNPLRYEYKLLLSVNYCDYLTASNGNSWCSCHYINSKGLFHLGSNENHYHGVSKAGTLSYANDDVSLVAYTLPSDAAENEMPYCWQKKVKRNMFHYADGLLLQGRVYPCSDDVACRDNFRKYVKDIIAECEGEASEWEDVCFGVSKHFELQDGAMCYPDWAYTEGSGGYYKCVESSLRPVMDKHGANLDDTCYTIGSEALDIYYDTTLYNSGELTRRVYVKICAHCGREIDTNRGDYVSDGNGEIYLCAECYEEHYVFAQPGNKLVLKDDPSIRMADDGVWVFLSKWDACVRTCEHCGKTMGHLGSLWRTSDNHELCHDCYENHTRYCSVCHSRFYDIDAMTEEDGRLYCRACHAARHGQIRRMETTVGDDVLSINEALGRLCNEVTANIGTLAF